MPWLDVETRNAMMIKKNPDDLSKPKTLKVTLPTRMHLQLHQLKILSGENISDMVEEALVDYFHELKEDREETPASSPPEAEA